MPLKDELIFALEKNRGRYISGQDIAGGRNISRTAVWKCVNSLKSEGYDIISANNAGYMLAPECFVLSAPGIKAHLPDYLRDSTAVTVFGEVDSTNDAAKRAVAQGLEGDAIFAANGQTAGRGRRGRSFYSPSGSGLYFTSVLRPAVGLADATALTAAAAVAAARGIFEETGIQPKIKWVNDLLYGGKKVCGILSEAVTDLESGAVQAVVVGIGINLATEDFPGELRDVAASLAPGGKIDKNSLAARIFAKLKDYCDRLPDRGYMEDYRALSAVVGGTVTFTLNGTAHAAKAVAIRDDGALEVEENGTAILLRGGEVSIKL